MRTTADVSPFDWLWTYTLLPTTHSCLGGLTGNCTYSEQTKTRIINSTECAAAAANALTHKAAVTAALALALFEFEPLPSIAALHGIFLSQSNGTRANLIFVIKIPAPRVARLFAGIIPEEVWHIRAGSFVLCSLSVSYMLKMMLWPSTHKIRTSLTYLPSYSAH